MTALAQPGSSVYLYYGPSGVLVYVGVTDRGTRRLHEHADSKPWWPLVTGCSIEHYVTREDALDRERYVISQFRPAFNYQHNPDRLLSDEEKFAKVGYAPKQHVTAGIQSMPTPQVYEGLKTLKERRQFFYTLTSDQKKYYPCVQCGERPGLAGRPSCASCRASERRAKIVPIAA